MSARTAGIDEAGRGPLAGPVVAAAVILRRGRVPVGLKDSKQLDAITRERLCIEIRRDALGVGIGWADPAEIDVLNILQATFLAMRRAVLSLPLRPDSLLVDGNCLPSLAGLGAGLCALAIVRGDVTERAISAASIVAKCERDAYMLRMHELYPQYDFANHKGYPTAEHRRLLAQWGPCPLHRRTFAPLKLPGEAAA
ncbi:MAG: ribonuclease HII [Steroidobacterales bacterium]